MRIAIDLMGGDNAPAAVAEGCALALQKLSEDTELVIFGEESAAKALSVGTVSTISTAASAIDANLKILFFMFFLL